MNLVKSKKKEHLRVTAFGDTTKNIQYYIIKTLKIETSLEHEENPNHIMKKKLGRQRHTLVRQNSSGLLKCENRHDID